MNVRPGRQIARGLVAFVCASTALALSIATPAFADDPLGGTLEETEGVLDETVDDTTDAVGDSVDTITEVVTDSTAGAGDVAAAADDAITDANGSTNDVVGKVGQSGDGSGSTDGSAGAPGGSNRGTSDGQPGERRERDGAPARDDSSRRDAFGVREWVWEPSDRVESAWAIAPAEARLEQIGARDDTDPCLNDRSLVCLGLLYGMGRYARFFSSVLGVLATTGIGIVALMIVALALGTSGSAALFAARRRSTATAGRL